MTGEPSVVGREALRLSIMCVAGDFISESYQPVPGCLSAPLPFQRHLRVLSVR